MLARQVHTHMSREMKEGWEKMTMIMMVYMERKKRGPFGKRQSRATTLNKKKMLQQEAQAKLLTTEGAPLS